VHFVSFSHIFFGQNVLPPKVDWAPTPMHVTNRFFAPHEGKSSVLQCINVGSAWMNAADDAALQGRSSVHLETRPTQLIHSLHGINHAINADDAHFSSTWSDRVRQSACPGQRPSQRKRPVVLSGNQSSRPLLSRASLASPRQAEDLDQRNGRR